MFSPKELIGSAVTIKITDPIFAGAIPLEVRSHIDKLLIVSESGCVSGFENLKADPGRPGVDNLQRRFAVYGKSRRVADGQDRALLDIPHTTQKLQNFFRTRGQLAAFGVSWGLKWLPSDSNPYEA